jgi:cysteine desulfurase
MSINRTIYLDYQASTPIDPRVKAALIDAMDQDFANPSSESHSAGWQARQRVEDARSTIARAVGCDADELIFTSGATEADNIGVLGAALGAPSGRRRIIVGSTEHKAVLEAAFAAEGHGFHVELLPVDRNGLIEPEELGRRLDETVAVVSVMLVNNEIGTIQPLKRLVEQTAEVGAVFHTDATQAPTAMDVDLHELGVDAASFSSHKIYGPKGIGALYVSAVAPWRPKPLMHGGGQEQGLRPGTLPTPLCSAFAHAFQILVEEGSAERERISKLRDQLLCLLAESIPDLKITATPPAQHPGNLHVRIEGISANDLLTRLQPRVFAATGSACTSGQNSFSHVLEAIGQAPNQCREGLRISIGRTTDQSQIEEASRLIAITVDQIRTVGANSATISES